MGWNLATNPLIHSDLSPNTVEFSGSSYQTKTPRSTTNIKQQKNSFVLNFFLDMRHQTGDQIL